MCSFYFCVYRVTRETVHIPHSVYHDCIEFPCNYVQHLCPWFKLMDTSILLKNSAAMYILICISSHLLDYLINTDSCMHNFNIRPFRNSDKQVVSNDSLWIYVKCFTNSLLKDLIFSIIIIIVIMSLLLWLEKGKVSYWQKLYFIFIIIYTYWIANNDYERYVFIFKLHVYIIFLFLLDRNFFIMMCRGSL